MKNRNDTTAAAQLKAVTVEKQNLERRIERLEDFVAQLQQELTDVRVEKVKQGSWPGPSLKCNMININITTTITITKTATITIIAALMMIATITRIVRRTSGKKN